jgi:predicted lipoprotein with Yx(FWY)xxD motif
LKLRLVLVATLVSAAALGGEAAAPARAPDAKPRPDLTARNSQFGRIIFDTRGRALYAFTRDPRRGRSRCYGACAVAWPVYYAKRPLRAGKGIRQALIGTTRRRNGRLQLTYNGWPLYYYVNDVRPGQVTCQNVNEYGGLWLVVRPNGRLVR